MKLRTLVLILLLIGAASIGFAANRYAVANGSWANTGTWSATSGGSPGASAPITGDIVYIGEGANSYAVTIPSGNHGCTQLNLGNASGNAAAASLTFNTGFSLLTVTGTLSIYSSTASVTRTVNVGPGTLTVNGNAYISRTGPFIPNSSSVCSIAINGGTVTVADLNFYAASGFPLQSQVVFLGSGLMNMKGNLNLINGAGTLIPGTGTVVFNGFSNQAIAGGPDILFYNLNVNNNAGVTLSGLVVAEGTWTQANGNISGTPPNVDGFTSSNLYYIDINADDNMVIGYSIAMTTPALFPNYIDREWTLDGSYAGIKTVTFYWTHVDDHSFDWTDQIPVVWMGGKSYTGSYNVTTQPHYVTVVLDADFDITGVYRIGMEPDPTLPVELSSFTAVVTAQNYVKLDWVTQSETGVQGFYMYRNVNDNLIDAMVVSPLIYAANTSQEYSYSFVDSEVQSGTYYYWLQNMDMDGSFNFHGSINVTVTEGGENPPPPDVTYLTSLANIYPNPFNPLTTITYSLAKAEQVRIVVFNVKGELVSTLASGTKESGDHSVRWNGSNEQGKPLPSGIYFINMTTSQYTSTQKAILLK